MYWVILSNLEFPTIFYFIFVITRLSLFVLQWTTFIASCGADSAPGNQTLVLLISNVRHCPCSHHERLTLSGLSKQSHNLGCHHMDLLLPSKFCCKMWGQFQTRESNPGPTDGGIKWSMFSNFSKQGHNLGCHHMALLLPFVCMHNATLLCAYFAPMFRTSGLHTATLQIYIQWIILKYSEKLLGQMYWLRSKAFLPYSLAIFVS